MHVAVLVGSSRADSLNRRLATVLEALLPPDVVVDRLDLLDELPLFTQPREEAGAPATVQDLRRRVTAADAVVTVTPEHNGSVSASLKNAIDWLSRPREASSLAGKPVAVVAATPSANGAASARDHLVTILSSARALPLPATVGVASADTSLDADPLEASEDIRALLDELLRLVPA